MNASIEERVRIAAAAGPKEIDVLLHDLSPLVIRALLANPLITEEQAALIAARRNVPADLLEAIARDRRWSGSYPVRLALAGNPKTPLFSALSVVRYLRFMDQIRLTRDMHLPVVIRKKIEAIVIEQIPTMALGMKKTVAKIAGGDVLLKLLQDGYPEVVALSLDNPRLIESHLYKVVNRAETRESTIRIIAGHPGWSARYAVRYSLIRNEHTPLARSVFFLRTMKTGDLQELYLDRSLPQAMRPCIHRELLRRGVEAGSSTEERIFEAESGDEVVMDDPEYRPEGEDDDSVTREDG